MTSTRRPILLFDLGNTLVEYFRPRGFAPVLWESLRLAGEALRAAGHPVPSAMEVKRRVAAERHDPRNHRVRPLEQRLARVFALRGDSDGQVMEAMRRAFMGPVFAAGRRYDDTLDALSSWRGRGYRIGILSNSPWGTPAAAWHQELERQGLAERCDRALFCGEVGWRKPALPMFRAALNHFACRPEECLFIGDDPRWDEYGARRAGMTPVLIDRLGVLKGGAGRAVIHSLAELEPILQRWDGSGSRGVPEAALQIGNGAEVPAVADLAGLQQPGRSEIE